MNFINRRLRQALPALISNFRFYLTEFLPKALGVDLNIDDLKNHFYDCHFKVISVNLYYIIKLILI